MWRILPRLGRQRVLILGVLLILIASACSAFSARQVQPVGATATATIAADLLAGPNPSLSPDQVVQIQLEALKHNDLTDSGIALVYRFASVGNG